MDFAVGEIDFLVIFSPVNDGKNELSERESYGLARL